MANKPTNQYIPEYSSSFMYLTQQATNDIVYVPRAYHRVYIFQELY